MLSIPFGPSKYDLGFYVVGDLAPSEPYSFAIASDDSIWITDRWKRRLVHYSTTGRLLGEVPVSTETSGRLHDIEFLGTTLYAEADEQYGHMLAVDPNGNVRTFAATSAGKPIFTQGFYPNPIGLVTSSSGYTESLLGSGPQDGPFGYLTVDPETGKTKPIPGIPIQPGSFFSLDETQRDETFDARFIGPDGTLVQPLTIRYTRDGRQITPSAGGPAEFTIVGGSVFSFVEISASRPQDIHDGGRWLLRIGHGPLIWERVPQPMDGFDDSVQWRHMAVGPDGAIYLMLETKKGVQILRRPPT